MSVVRPGKATVSKSRSEEAALAGLAALKKGRATTGQAAKIFQVSHMTILDWIGKSKIPAIQIGGRQYIMIPDLIAAGASLPPVAFVEGAKGYTPIDSNATNESDTGDYYD